MLQVAKPPKPVAFHLRAMTGTRALGWFFDMRGNLVLQVIHEQDGASSHLHDSFLRAERLIVGSPWDGVLDAAEAELRRTAQRVGERDVLASLVLIRVPEKAFSAWAPVLGSIVEELGVELVRWAQGRGSTWFGGQGPSLSVELAAVAETEIIVEFSGDVSGSA